VESDQIRVYSSITITTTTTISSSSSQGLNQDM
jgi:hypothetical protein